MKVTMQVTIPFFNQVLAEVVSMSEYYNRHTTQTTPQPGLPEWINRCWYMGEISEKVNAGMYCDLSGNKIIYIRSSGNWVLLDKNTVEIQYSGRRHSLREILNCGKILPQYGINGWKYTVTQEPDLAPWETTT